MTRSLTGPRYGQVSRFRWDGGKETYRWPGQIIASRTDDYCGPGSSGVSK